MTPRLQHYIELMVFLVILAVTWWYFTTPPAPIGEWTAPKKDGRLKGLGSHTVPASGVVVIDDGAKDKLDLPDPVKKDPKKHVTAAVVIKPSERTQSVVSIFDEATGQTETLTQRMGYPLLATEQRGQLWLGYGIKNGGARVGRILLREDLLQVMALHAGVAATVDMDGGYFVGAGVAYRW